MLGMHGSGISLTARLLHLVGVQRGLEEDPLDSSLERRSAASRRGSIVELNDAILDELGGSWWRPPHLPPRWTSRSPVTALAARAREMVDSEFGDARQWGWKDARTSLTLPFWREVVPDARYVVCLRNPADVATSLAGREPTTHTLETADALWLRYIADALANTSGHERLLVFYEDLFADRDRQLARLAAFVGKDVGELPGQTLAEIAATVDAELPHHRSSSLELAESEDVALESRAFFLALRAAHLASMMAEDCPSDILTRVEPTLIDAVERVGAQLAPHAEHQRSIEEAQRERDAARAAERGYRIALDRTREELENARLGTEKGASAGSPGGKAASPSGAHTQADADEELARLERALFEAKAEVEHERSARLALENSLSMKVTTPLRYGKQALSRARGVR